MSEIQQPKFKIGEEVNILSSPGWTGTVILSEPYEKRYLIDCHPGAVGNYTWVWMDMGDGPAMFALNWLKEEELCLKNNFI